MYSLEGISSVANFINAYEESLKKRDSHFLIRSVFFCFQIQSFLHLFNGFSSTVLAILEKKLQV